MGKMIEEVWGITDGKDYLCWGGSESRAKDVILDMKSDPIYHSMDLNVIRFNNIEEFEESFYQYRKMHNANT